MKQKRINLGVTLKRDETKAIHGGGKKHNVGCASDSFSCVHNEDCCDGLVCCSTWVYACRTSSECKV